MRVPPSRPRRRLTATEAGAREGRAGQACRRPPLVGAAGTAAGRAVDARWREELHQYQREWQVAPRCPLAGHRSAVDCRVVVLAPAAV
eukprot:6073324-Prymnesium_polylepis.1